VLGFVRRLGVHEREVEDVAQEVFVIVHRQLPAFEGRSTLKTWVCGIAKGPVRRTPFRRALSSLPRGRARNVTSRWSSYRAIEVRPGLSVSYEQPQRSYLGLSAGSAREYSEATAREIDSAVKAAVERAFLSARDLLARHRELLERGAQKLLEVESLDEAQLALLFGPLRAQSQRPNAAG